MMLRALTVESRSMATAWFYQKLLELESSNPFAPVRSGRGV
jgi:hypothetical protein